MVCDFPKYYKQMFRRQRSSYEILRKHIKHQASFLSENLQLRKPNTSKRIIKFKSSAFNVQGQTSSIFTQISEHFALIPRLFALLCNLSTGLSDLLASLLRCFAQMYKQFDAFKRKSFIRICIRDCVISIIFLAHYKSEIRNFLNPGFHHEKHLKMKVI